MAKEGVRNVLILMAIVVFLVASLAFAIRGQAQPAPGGMTGPGMVREMMGGQTQAQPAPQAPARPGERHKVDPSSPSDVMMEECLGPEGHTIMGRMIDEMHGEGAHHRMHKFMDNMMRGGMMSMMMAGR